MEGYLGEVLGFGMGGKNLKTFNDLCTELTATGKVALDVIFVSTADAASAKRCSLTHGRHNTRKSFMFLQLVLGSFIMGTGQKHMRQSRCSLQRKLIAHYSVNERSSITFTVEPFL
jgi:hypothetical protein